MQQQQAGMENAYGQQYVNGFMNDPNAQMGLQIGKSAMMTGAHYMEQNLNRYVSVSALKHYFNVSNSYVVRKLLLVLLPWRHRPWTRQQTRLNVGPDGSSQQYSNMYLPPRDDLNSPDMYIPIMSLITYILLSTVLAGIRGTFRPEILGSITTTSIVVIVFEIVILRLAIYLLNITNESSLLDMAAYAGYKFVGVIVTLFLSEILTGGRGTNNWIGWTIFVYTWNANSFFLLRSLKYVLLPDSSNDPALRGGANYTVARSTRNARTYSLFAYAYIFQLAFMWALSREDGIAAHVIAKASA